ncbi:nucleotide disphospho-sugar-binding domain-containing protein [Streptomyces odontomachi]|uniref:nucleotide disphospho-sugar-binding domain-containing protein n=1 Tax=Streptomyces odontomachi TaxID=2944940 RepID=UPI00210BC726|nr:nucleotide disphospho-sugar-binding domain-containing protein [Streptomyces sp. ODS25]
MKVLFVPWGLATHYFHMVPLAWAMRAAGHDVRIASQPPCADAVKSTGMLHVTLAEDHDFNAEFVALAERLRGAHKKLDENELKLKVTDEDRAALRKIRFVPFVNSAIHMADDLVRCAEEWRPDLIVADPIVLAAPLAAETIGVPMVHYMWGPALSRQIGLPTNGVPVDEWSEDLVALYERHGVKPRPEYQVGTVDTCTADLQIPSVTDRIPMRYVPYNGPGEVPGWLAERPKRPRVCVTWGTTTTEMAGDGNFAIPTILKGLAELDVEVVLAVGAAERERLTDLPDFARVVTGMPLNLLLPTCDGLIHQGGSGTLLTAAALGVPQTIVVTMPYQQLNAKQLANVGCGIQLFSRDIVEDRIASAVSSILYDDAIRASSQRLREEIGAQPTPAETVGTLEKLI